jgi:hypothetical protein
MAESSGASGPAGARPTWKFLLPLIALAVIYSIGLSVVFLFSHGLVAPQESQSLYFLIFDLLLTWWVRIDRLARRFAVPYEYDVLVYVAWPFMVPYYLYRTRGWKGILLGVGIWGLCIAPVIVAVTVAVFFFRQI